MSVKDKVVVITGGAQGIGRFTARRFAAQGSKIAIADIASMDSVVAEVEALDAEILPIKTDITQERQVESLMDQVYRRWGRIDVLIQPAGIVSHFHVGNPRWPRIRSMPAEFFRKVIDTNLGGTFLCTKHVLPYMESLNDGHIINFGQGNLSERRSEGAGPGNIGTNAYSTSKIAIRAFTRFVADEEREFNICIMSMSPSGTTSTESMPPRRGEWKAGNGGGIVTEDSPDWARVREWGTVEDVGDRFVVAAEAPIEFTGHQVVVKDGKLEIASD